MRCSGYFSHLSGPTHANLIPTSETWRFLFPQMGAHFIPAFLRVFALPSDRTPHTYWVLSSNSYYHINLFYFLHSSISYYLKFFDSYIYIYTLKKKTALFHLDVLPWRAATFISLRSHFPHLEQAQDTIDLLVSGATWSFSRTSPAQTLFCPKAIALTVP